MRIGSVTGRQPIKRRRRFTSSVFRKSRAFAVRWKRCRRKLGFKGTLFQFLDFVAIDPQFAPFTTEKEVLDGYRKIEARLTPLLPKFFGRLPRAPFEIRATEKFRAATAPAESTSDLPAATAGVSTQLSLPPVPIVTPFVFVVACGVRVNWFPDRSNSGSP